MLYLFTVVLCVIVSGVIIWRFAAIYQMNANILKMQGEIREIQAQNSALKQEVEKLQSPDRLKEEAARLGFNLQDEKQGNAVAQVDYFVETEIEYNEYATRAAKIRNPLLNRNRQVPI